MNTSDKKTLLIVEDDPVLSDLLTRHFSKGPLDVVTASNGEEALALLEEASPSVAILDILMPKIDGFGFLEQLRARNDAFKDLPVIITSNLEKTEDKKRAEKLGVHAYFVKALSPIEKIEEAIMESIAE